LVRVRAAAVTTADWRFRTATFPTGFRLAGRLMVGVSKPRNRILGMDFSGVVAATGNEVTQFRVGDAVFGSTSATRLGAHAEYVTVSQDAAILPKPAFLGDDEAAAIPFGASTALSFLRDVARVEPGQRVLVIGASGNVGVWAVQIARLLGGRVTGVCSARNAELVRSLGAESVVDYAREDLRGQFDVVIDTVGVSSFSAVKPLLARPGTYVPLVGGVREILQALVTRWSDRRVAFAISEHSREKLAEVLHFVAAGALRPVVDSVYPMSEIARAHAHVEGRHKRGSVVVSMAQ
jgi:NADPH:quinone reductase-like Zn-dependent oxidoreductase